MRRRRHRNRGIGPLSMGSFRESRTARNLLISYSAEAQARTRYNFFARRAEEDGYIQVARIFDETAAQEYEHALRFFKFFNGGELEISGSVKAASSRTPVPIYSPPPNSSASSTRRCTGSLPGSPVTKDWPGRRIRSMRSALPNGTTKSCFAAWPTISPAAGFLPAATISSGNASVAAMCTGDGQPRTNARPASGLRAISHCSKRIGRRPVPATTVYQFVIRQRCPRVRTDVSPLSPGCLPSP